jgi:2-keto-4-pentenoate hydratase/2-oxohepta-3-ene-1,7-dioic acid hydratase in catechol pathway
LKLLNFRAEGRETVGALGLHGVIDLGARLGHDVSDILTLIRAGLMGPARSTAAMEHRDYALEDVEVLKPIGRDTRYFCIGVNYPDRNEEYKDGSDRPKYPSLFMRSHTSLVGHGEPILRPRESQQLDYEGEVVVVIGVGGRRIRQEAAMAHVLGYTCANEGSVRDWMRHSKFNVTQGKNFDRSGAIGPYIVTADEVGPAPLRVVTRINAEERQNDTTDRMLFPIPYLISYLSTFCSLEPGDVILSGTPTGAGARFDPPRYLASGDIVEVEVSRVGVLRNAVVDDVG